MNARQKLPGPATNPVAEALDLPDAPILRTTPAAKSGMCFLELDVPRRNAGLSLAVSDDAFLIALQLKTCPDFDLYADGRLIKPHQFDAGATAIFDLRTKLASDLRDPFHAIDLYIPGKALDAIADDIGVSRISELRHRPGAAVRDTVAGDLLLSMRPALAVTPEHTARLFVDHVAMALAAHVATTYGGMSLPRSVPRGGLARWQERRAKEMLAANLTGNIALSDLASACDLSVRHFTRAFRQSFGMTPHRWLRRQRVELAKSLLLTTSRKLTDIALSCGFADQSHFTRTFAREVGAPPAAWRRVMHQ